MTRLSITVDERLLEEAQELAQVRTKRETIECALVEFVQRRRAAKLFDLAGSYLIEFDVPSLREWRQACDLKP